MRSLTDAVNLPDDDARLGRMRSELTTRARDEGLLDVSYRVIDSPVGSLLLAASEAGLVRVAFDIEGHDAVLSDLAARLSPRIMPDDGARLDRPARELTEYFEGRRREFSLPVDLALASGFRRQVLDALRTVHFGERLTYSELAVRSGRERAVRAAASACATNPIPLVVPCHRIVRTDGTLGGYRGGLPAKELLLGLERPA